MSNNVTLAAKHGTRKAAVANAHLLPGKGEFVVSRSLSPKDVLNAKRRGVERSALKTTFTVDQYFSTISAQKPLDFLKEVLAMVNCVDNFKVVINVKGGGLKSQLHAARLAIAKALVKYNPELKPLLGSECRTDARKKERSKIGCRGKARRKVQFSKR